MMELLDDNKVRLSHLYLQTPLPTLLAGRAVDEVRPLRLVMTHTWGRAKIWQHLKRHETGFQVLAAHSMQRLSSLSDRGPPSRAHIDYQSLRLRSYLLEVDGFRCLTQEGYGWRTLSIQGSLREGAREALRMLSRRNMCCHPIENSHQETPAQGWARAIQYVLTCVIRHRKVPLQYQMEALVGHLQASS